MLNFSTKIMAVKFTKVKSALALYQKFNVTICVESFILVSKSTHKAPFLALCRSTIRVLLIFKNTVNMLIKEICIKGVSSCIKGDKSLEKIPKSSIF